MQDISLEQAIECLISQVQEQEVYEEVALEAAHGRILAESIYAPMSQPPFDRSPLDGYAFKAEDSKEASKEQPIRLKVIGEVCAGDYFEKTVQSGEAVRIMTGAPIPKGCDCVLRQEDTDYGEETVLIYKSLKSYSNYCFTGEDIKAGQILLEKGEKLSAITQGVLASMGMAYVKVKSKLKVAVICTGDELTPLGQPLAPGKIYNSNGLMITQRGAEVGVEMEQVLVCSDTADEVAALIKEKAHQVDLIITTGGVSVGKKDIMHEVVQSLEANRLFWRVQIQPGTPVLAFTYKGCLTISLSGNPFAALTNFELLVRPVLAKLEGNKQLVPMQRRAILQDDFNKRSVKRRFIRAQYEDGKVYLNHQNHSSGALYTMSLCNALIDIPAGTEKLEKGTQVQVVLL